MQAIQARIVEVDDIGARRLSAAENHQREDLTVFEAIESIVEIVDAELIADREYASMEKTPLDRIKTFLGQLDSVRSSQSRGSEVSNRSKALFHKFVEQVEGIFKNLPKPLEWRSFYIHDLPLLLSTCKEVRDTSIQHNLNKSQIKALEKLKKVSENEFKRFANPEPSAPKVEPQLRAHSQPFIKNARVGNSDKYRSELRWSHISCAIIVCLKLGAMHPDANATFETLACFCLFGLWPKIQVIRFAGGR